MTHDHDFELIVAIAEAEMSPADQAAAEASLASCEVCRVDLELQREALSALGSAPAVVMTDLERARLRRMVAESVDETAPRSEPRRSTPWFQRLMPAMAAAAALLVVVGVGSVLVGNSGSDFDGAVAESTAVAGQAQREGADEEMDEISGTLEFDDMAEATTTTMAAAAPREPLVEYLGEISKADLRDQADRLVSEPTDGAATTGGQLESVVDDPDLMCATVAAEEGEVVLVRRATVEGVEVEIYRIDDRVDVYAQPDCSLIDPFEW